MLGYNALVRGNKFVLTKLNSFAHDLHAYFVTGARVQSGSGESIVVPAQEGLEAPWLSEPKTNPMR